jgi:hypothetical protein
MRRYTIIAAVSLLAAAVWAAPAEAPMPAVGEKAPAFALLGSDGRAHGLAAHRGQLVVLAFYPKAFTGG